jgi:hypothetical protein
MGYTPATTGGDAIMMNRVSAFGVEESKQSAIQEPDNEKWVGASSHPFVRLCFPLIDATGPELSQS